MADNEVAPANAAAAAATAQPRHPQTSSWDIIKSLASRMLMMYLVVTGMNYFRQKPTQNEAVTDPNVFEKGSKFVNIKSKSINHHLF